MAFLDDVSDSSSEEIEYEERVFRVGPHAFKVQCIGELPMEMLFRLESARDEISGQRAWPGSLLLGLELARAPGRVGGKAVLELGAGCGIVGMAAAKFGAKPCVLSDGDSRCLTLLKENVENNSLEASCGVMRLLWGVDTPHRTYDVVLAGDVLYKKELIAPFLAALEAALAEDGTALLCHLPRAGVSHEVVEAALRAREAAGGPALTTVRAPAVAVDFGDDCNTEDAKRARVYELSLPASDDDADARRSRFAVCVSNLADRVDLGAVQTVFRDCGVALVYRAGPREAVVCLNDEAGVVRALRLDGFGASALRRISVKRLSAEAREP